MPQVTPDCPASVLKMKFKTIAAWNIKTMLQKEKLDNIKQEMIRMEISPLGR